MVIQKKKKNNTNNYSTKQDNVPADGELRRSMIEQFITANQDDDEMFEVIEVVPYLVERRHEPPSPTKT